MHRSIRSIAPLNLATLLCSVLILPSPFGYSQTTRLDVNDVSFLWPAPKNGSEIEALINASDAIDRDGGAIWPEQSFGNVLDVAQVVRVANSAGRENQIEFGQFQSEFKDRRNWKVVGVRIDPSAPGTAPMVTKALGSIPQIRLILQPVTLTDSGSVRVHDLTAHLVFNYVDHFEPPSGGQGPPRAIPDKVAFEAVVSDLVVLKSKLKAAGIETNGVLSVHPGFQSGDTEFRSALKSFLKKHLGEDRLSAVAFMGLETPEPWIFFAMRNADGAMSIADQRTLGGHPAQMLTFRGGTAVMPAPVTSNVDGKGVSTAILFTNGIEQKLDEPAIEGRESPRIRDIPDIIANPQMSNFANTDCVSCHSESTRRAVLGLDAADEAFRFDRPQGISGVDESLLPKDRWNVRNFGWFPRGGKVAVTATMRTANEAAESADYINHEYLGD